MQYLVITLKMKPGCLLWLQTPACSGFCPCLSLCFVLSPNNPAKPQGFQFFETTDMFPVLAYSSSSSGLCCCMDSAFLHWTLTSYRPEQRCGLPNFPVDYSHFREPPHLIPSSFIDWIVKPTTTCNYELGTDLYTHAK